MVKEANAISVELKKNVSFQLTILTDSPYSPLPFSIASGTDVDIDASDVRLSHTLEPSKRGVGLERGPVVAIEVKDSKHGVTNVWSTNKFRYVHIVLHRYCIVCGINSCLYEDDLSVVPIYSYSYEIF